MLRASFWPAKLTLAAPHPAAAFPPRRRAGSRPRSGSSSNSSISAVAVIPWPAAPVFIISRRRDWDAEILQLTGLTTAQLGPLAGPVRGQAARFFPAIGDGAASNLGSGATRCRRGRDQFRNERGAAHDPARRCAVALRSFQVTSSIRSAISSAARSATPATFAPGVLRELRLPNDERALEQLLRKETRGAARLTILPFWVGERAPTWPENLTGTVVGLSQATTAADLLLAAFRCRLLPPRGNSGSAGSRARPLEKNHRLRRHPAIPGLAPDPGRFVRPRSRSLRRPGSVPPRRRRPRPRTARP